MYRNAAFNPALKGEERLLILPRRCFAEQADGETALEFLRQTFARKRRVKRSWLF